MDPSSYRLRSRSVPPNPLDHGQGVDTNIEGTPQSDIGEGSSGRVSLGLMHLGIHSSVAGPEVESASSGEKTLRADTHSRASADISETPTMPILSPVSIPRVPPIRIGRRPITNIGADIGDTNLTDTLAILETAKTSEIQTSRSETESISEAKLFISSDTEIKAKPQHRHPHHKHGSHAGSRTSAAAAFPIPLNNAAVQDGKPRP